MPLILVVEQEKRYVERIEEALGPQGWEVVGVDDRSAAMRQVADRAADLIVVNSEVEGSSELITEFARVNGGPGAVVLVPESDNGSVPPESDEVLRKPFTDQDLRLAVRRCLSASPEPEAAKEVASPASEVRLTSEDIFGDVVMELEGAFNLGGASASTDDQGTVVEEPEVVEAAPGDATAEDAVAEDVAPGVDSEAEIDAAEEALEVDAEPAPEHSEPVAEEPVEEDVALEEAEDEEPAEDEEGEEEPAEDKAEGEVVEAATEDKVVEEAVEKERGVTAEADEEEAVEQEAAEEEAVEEAPVEKPKKKLLEERLHEALAEGKAMASSRQSQPAAPSPDSGEAADLLLRKALATLSADSRASVRIDDEFAAPAHATAEEVDALVGTVVGKKIPVVEPPGAGDDANAIDEVMAESLDAAEEAPSLDVTNSDLLESDGGEYRTRMKILWIVILAVLAALVVFMVTRPSSDEPARPPSGTQTEDAASGAVGEAEAPDGELAEPAGDAGGGATTEDGESSPTDEVAAREERLRRQLAAERRQLRAEINRAQGGTRAPDNEEDGDGAQAPAS